MQKQMRQERKAILTEALRKLPPDQWLHLVLPTAPSTSSLLLDDEAAADRLRRLSTRLFLIRWAEQFSPGSEYQMEVRASSEAVFVCKHHRGRPIPPLPDMTVELIPHLDLS